VAGCATPTGSAGHAGATANLELTFHLDHSAGADHADSQQQFLYVGADKGITVVDRKTLDVVGAIQPAGILGPGHHIATDSKDNIYLAQTTAGMQKLVFKGIPPTQ
jgi:hypothetical protein